jgi:hypothetical protein
VFWLKTLVSSTKYTTKESVSPIEKDVGASLTSMAKVPVDETIGIPAQKGRRKIVFRMKNVESFSTCRKNVFPLVYFPLCQKHKKHSNFDERMGDGKFIGGVLICFAILSLAIGIPVFVYARGKNLME